MNKKLLLFALPALMAMSSCTYLESGTVQNPNFFKEEASAKADIFGGEEQAVALRKNLPFRSAEADMAEPVIGVQYRAAYEKDSKSYIAVRFVAAIKSLDVNAEWTRSVYEADGSRHGSEASYETTQAYTALSGMGKTIYPSSYGTGYNYFVAYTLYDIPATGKENLYIVANLKLTDTKEEDKLSPVYSKAMAARIGGGVTAKFDKDQSGFFLAGKINNQENVVLNQDGTTKEDYSGQNAASFTGSFVDGDQFVVAQKTASTFRVWDNGCLEDANDDVLKTGKLIEINADQQYTFYLNKSNQIYHTKYGAYLNYYIRGAAGVGWDTYNNSYRFVTDPDNIGVLLNVSLSVGDFKIGDSTWSHEWGYFSCKDGGSYFYPNEGNEYYSIIIGGAKGNFEAQDGYNHGVCNIHCKVAGNYNIYLTKNFYVSVELA